jgi:cytochrome c
MKARWISIPAAALMILSTRQVLTDETPADEVLTGIALAQKNGCLQCHAVDKNGIGPAFHNIAAKYKEKPDARDTLINTVKKGGKGNWTDISRGVPMPPFSRSLSDAEIENLVDWVLNL